MNQKQTAVRPGDAYEIPPWITSDLDTDDVREIRHAMDARIKSAGSYPVNSRTVLHTLADQARIVRIHKAELDRHWEAEWKAGRLGLAWHQANYVGAGWATGNADEFNEWAAQYEADYDTVRKLADMDGAQPIHAGNVPPYEGEYGYTVTAVGCIVTLHDTNGNALLVPWDAEVPQVEDYAEIPTCAHRYGGGCGETFDLCDECGCCREHCACEKAIV